MNHEEEEDLEMELEDEGSGFASMFMQAGKEGLKLAAAKEANSALTDGIKKALEKAGMTPLMLEAPIVHKGLPLATAALLLFLCERFPEAIPKAKHVARAAQLALTTASAETIQPLFAAAMPALAALAASGEKMAELEGEVTQPKAKAKAKAPKAEAVDIDFADISDDDEVEDAEFDNIIEVEPTVRS